MSAEITFLELQLFQPIKCKKIYLNVNSKHFLKIGLITIINHINHYVQPLPLVRQSHTLTIISLFTQKTLYTMIYLISIFFIADPKFLANGVPEINYVMHTAS